MRESPFPLSALVDPAILPRPAEEIAGPVVDELKRLSTEFGVTGIREPFFARTLTCRKQCHTCDICRDYYAKEMKKL